MKTIILVSESIFNDGNIAVDLNNPEHFDVRVVRDINEILVLSTALTPKGVVIDLDNTQTTEADLKNLINRTRFNPNPNSSVTPFLGITGPQTSFTAESLYALGFNLLLAKPCNELMLREALEVILGVRIRKSMRKKVNWSIGLKTADDKTFDVQGKVINLECLLVQGEGLCPEGHNVLLTNLPPEFDQDNLWGHCWRNARGCLIVRFLNPSESFLQAIDRLPEDADGLALPDAPQTPAIVISAAVLQATCGQIRTWIVEEQDPPAEWQAVLKEMKPQQKQVFAGSSDEDKILARGYTFKILLDMQLAHLQMDNNPGDISALITELEAETSGFSESLQRYLMEHAMSQNAQRVTQINELKSDLQKVLAKIRMLGRL